MKLIDNYVFGPVELPPNLNGRHYHNFPQNELPDYFNNLPLHLRKNIIFMQDGAPAHHSRNFRDFLNTIFPNHWIGRKSQMSWPARSPDFSPLDFYVRG